MKRDDMPIEERIDRADALMRDYAVRTRIREGGGTRYLWTDAFAVCNFIALARATGNESQRELALLLIERVHHTLGRHRSDAARQGWLPGASAEHPTRGGLRIGKPLDERANGEPIDERLEWDRDGQYFHYLTKWMHALDQAARAARRPGLNLWARELAEGAHAGFVYRPPGGGAPRMHWKMSIDLSRALVPSMGHHDPLDGYITAAELVTTAKAFEHTAGPRLEAELSDYAAMIRADELATADPLGLGGLLADAHRVEQLLAHGAPIDPALLPALLQGALAGVTHYVRTGEPGGPAELRLAFRELGLAIGLDAVERMADAAERDELAGGSDTHALVARLRRHVPLRDEIVAFWLRDESRRARTWTEHPDINQVMLATSLVPEGYLTLIPPL